MDIIFYNGSVNTLDGSGTVYSAVGAANGMVAALGTDEELRRLMGRKTEAIDLKGAALSFDETRNGSIEAGKRADFTVMAADPRQVSPEEVPQIPISMTVVGGEIVHSQ